MPVNLSNPISKLFPIPLLYHTPICISFTSFTSFASFPSCHHKRRHKQHPQRQIRPRKHQIPLVRPPLHHQRHHRHTKRKLLHHRRNHHRPQPHRVRPDNQKRNLPCQCATHKPVIKSRMRNRWRVVLPNQIKQKIQRCDHHQSPNPRHPKHHLRKFHLPSLCESQRLCVNFILHTYCLQLMAYSFQLCPHAAPFNTFASYSF